MKNNLSVGDEVVVVRQTRNFINGKREEIVYKEKVISIGRKYVTVTKYNSDSAVYRFSKEDYYKWGFVGKDEDKVFMYESMEEYQREVLRKDVYDFVVKKMTDFSCLRNLSLEQLEKIKAILEETGEE